jgi:hypothetical protein
MWHFFETLFMLTGIVTWYVLIVLAIARVLHLNARRYPPR